MVIHGAFYHYNQLDGLNKWTLVKRSNHRANHCRHKMATAGNTSVKDQLSVHDAWLLKCHFKYESDVMRVKHLPHRPNCWSAPSNAAALERPGRHTKTVSVASRSISVISDWQCSHFCICTRLKIHSQPNLQSTKQVRTLVRFVFVVVRISLFRFHLFILWRKKTIQVVFSVERNENWPHYQVLGDFFKQIQSIELCLEAVDGKHAEIQQPETNSHNYLDESKTISQCAFCTCNTPLRMWKVRWGDDADPVPAGWWPFFLARLKLRIAKNFTKQ